MFYQILLLISLVLKTAFSIDDITKDLLTPILEYGEACGYMSCPSPVAGSLNVHVVPATHVELGVYRTFYEYYSGLDVDIYGPNVINMKYILDNVITELWRNPNRKFTVMDVPYFFSWWKDRDGTVRRMVYQLLRQGRLFFAGGGWGMSDESTTSYHAIIDHFTYALRKINATFMDCGRPLVTWQADAYGHSREFASLMAQMGFDGHFINPISFDQELDMMRAKAMEFVWRGSDDLGRTSDIFTHKLFDGYWSPPGFCFGTYCADPLIITSDSQFRNLEERAAEFVKQILRRQAPYYSTRHVMVIMGTRFGYHDAQHWFANTDKLIYGVNSRTAVKDKVQMYYSTPACYVKAIQQQQPKLQTKQDDFIPLAFDEDSYVTGMFTSRPTIKYMAREIHLLLQIVKQLQVFAQLTDKDKKIEDIHWIAGVINDHTIMAGNMRTHVAKYYTRKVHVAKAISMQIVTPALNKLRNAMWSTVYYMCPFNASSCWTLSGDTSYIVIYNPLAWPVTLPVRLPVKRSEYTLHDHKGENINHSIIRIPELASELPQRSQADHEPTMDDELVFIADSIPPMGYRSYYLKQTFVRNKRSIFKKLTTSKKYITRNIKKDEQVLMKDDYIDYNDLSTYNPPIAEVPTWTPPATTTEFSYVTKLEEMIDQIKKAATDNNHTLSYMTKPKLSQLIYPFAAPGFFYKLRALRRHNSTSELEKFLRNMVPPKSQAYDWDLNYRNLEKIGYFHEFSKDTFIKNEYITIHLNSNGKAIANMTLSNGVAIALDITMFFYVSDDPEKMATKKKAPGPYVFRPMDPKPEFISQKPTIKVLKSELVEEIHIMFSYYAGLALILYKSLPYVEVDWIVGPIPVHDELGKDIFIRYSTDLQNNGVFNTDCNGRQMMKRIKDMRATFVPRKLDNVTGNFYPVTTKVYIVDENKNIRFSIFPDRAEACASLNEGQLDFLLHRRILTDEGGRGTLLNETEFDKGLVVRGKHRLYLSKADYKPNKIFEKKFAKELELQPQIFASAHPHYANISYNKWREHNNEYSALKLNLPIGVHILTVQTWYEHILLRLENYLEKGDAVRNEIKTVFIKDLFKDFRIISARETMLGGNIWRDDYIKMMWNSEMFVKRFNDVYGNYSNLEFVADETKGYEKPDLEKGIQLAPQQIRTFVCSYERV